MVNALNYLSGKYVTAERLPTDRRVVAVITAVAPEFMELSNEEKLVLSLRSTTGKAWSQKMVLNVSNGKTLVDAFGKDTDRWIGQTIEAWQAPTRFGNKMVPGIKLAALNGSGAAQPVLEATPVTAPQTASISEPLRRSDAINAEVQIEHYEPGHEPGGGDLGDEIPWAPSVQ